MLENLAGSGRGLVTFAIASVLSLAQTASAQSRPSPAVEFAAGALLFPDDGLVTKVLRRGPDASTSRRGSASGRRLRSSTARIIDT